jgi:hypothetical protein
MLLSLRGKIFFVFILFSISSQTFCLLMSRLTVSNSKVRTRDMGGESTTHEFTRAILDKMDTL